MLFTIAKNTTSFFINKKHNVFLQTRHFYGNVLKLKIILILIYLKIKSNLFELIISLNPTKTMASFNEFQASTTSSENYLSKNKFLQQTDPGITT